jgi:hypothetical protein
VVNRGLSIVLANGVASGRTGGSVMVRTVWIGLVCLIVICGLTAYKIGFAAPARNSAGNQAAAAAPVAALADAQGSPAAHESPDTRDDPAAKTDRLDVDYLQDVPGKMLVHTIPIVISNPATPAVSATKAEPEKTSAHEHTHTVSRHWRSSYARYTRRHYRHSREAARPATEAKSEAKSAPSGLLGWLKSNSEASTAKR